jgi:tetratricopeptide (TPR) repeat protein
MKKRLSILFFIFILFCFGCKKTENLSFEQRGDKSFENHLYQNAVHYWNRSYQDNPQNYFLLYKTGKAFLKLGNIDKALEYFLKADKKISDNYEIKKDLIRLFIIKGNNIKAEKILEEISPFIKSDPEYYFLAGDINLVSKNSEKACQMYKQAVLFSKGSARSFIKLAIALYETQNYDEADKYILNIIKNYIISPEDKILLSDYFFITGELNSSENYILEALSSDNANLQFKNHLCSFYLKTQQIAKACKVLEKYIKEYPSNVRFKLLLADALIFEKDIKRAEALLEEIKNSGTKDLFEYNLIMGKLWLFKGKNSYAVSYLKEACEKKSYLVNGNFLLGCAYFAGGQLKLAEKSFTKALVLAPRHLESLYSMSLLHYKQKEYKLSLQYLDKIKDSDFFNPKYNILRGLCFFDQGDYKKAAEFFLEAFEVQGDLSSGFYLGKAKEALEDYDSAIEIYKKVLDNYAFNEEVFYRYILLLQKTNNKKAALRELDKHISLNCKNPEKNYVFACLAIKLNQTDKAEKLLEDALNKDFAFEGTYLKLASVYKNLGKYNDEEKILTKCTEKYPSCLECVLELGEYYYKRNNLEKAVFVYEKGIKFCSNSAILMSNYAWVLSVTGKDLDLALDYGRKAYELEPDEAFICDTLGYIYYLKKAYSQSLWMLEKAEEINPENWALKYHLGLLYLETGKLSKAKKSFELALADNISLEAKKEIQNILNNFEKDPEEIEFSDNFEDNVLVFPEKPVDVTDLLTPDWD